MDPRTMRLSALDPRWIERNGERIGVVFRCPHCVGEKFYWLTCYRVPMGNFGDQHEALAPVISEGNLHRVVPVKRDYAWSFVGDTFETLSITPSLDASASGHWHGYVTAGEIR